MRRISVRGSGNGVVIETERGIYAVDRTRNVRADYHIISHAHRDHLPSRIQGKPIASRETALLAERRGLPGLSAFEGEESHVELFDSGHILGSRATLIEEEILYTGDVNVRDRLFLKGFEPPKAKILIMESTYGRPGFVFEEFGEIVQKASEYILAALSQGRRVMALGYTLGKSQILTKLLSWYENLVVSDSVHVYNQLYRKLGVDIETDYATYREAKERGFLEKDNWVMISPSNTRITNHISKKYGAVKAGFSGWAKHPKFGFWSKADRCFALSDHADFHELTRIVKSVEPEKVYLMYGFVEELASYLRNLGYDAEPLNPSQKHITEY